MRRVYSNAARSYSVRSAGPTNASALLLLLQVGTFFFIVEISYAKRLPARRSERNRPNNSWAEFGRIAQGAKSCAKMALANHFFRFNIKQRDLFQVELNGDLLTQMK